VSFYLSPSYRVKLCIVAEQLVVFIIIILEVSEHFVCLNTSHINTHNTYAHVYARANL